VLSVVDVNSLFHYTQKS